MLHGLTLSNLTPGRRSQTSCWVLRCMTAPRSEEKGWSRSGFVTSDPWCSLTKGTNRTNYHESLLCNHRHTHTGIKIQFTTLIQMIQEKKSNGRLRHATAEVSYPAGRPLQPPLHMLILMCPPCRGTCTFCCRRQAGRCSDRAGSDRRRVR